MSLNLLRYEVSEALLLVQALPDPRDSPRGGVLLVDGG